MHQFHICIRSFRQIQDFVSLAMVQPFEVLVGNEKQQVNGKSFIGMFSLDFRKPLYVSVKCSEEVFDQFQKEAANIFT
jgi:predicted DNA-binding protein (MmcQ/YjbR family)